MTKTMKHEATNKSIDIIIEKLTEAVEVSKKLNVDPNESSFRNRTGALLNANEAKLILSVLSANNKLTDTLKHAYEWGRANGSNRSEKNFNDFIETKLK